MGRKVPDKARRQPCGAAIHGRAVPVVCNPQCLEGGLQRKQQMDGMRELARQIEAEEQRLPRKGKPPRNGKARPPSRQSSFL